jgi:hypothetical protein
MNEHEHDVLALDEEHPHHTRTKEALIQQRLGISPARFYQIRNRLLTDPEALAEFPTIARRVDAAAESGLRASLGRTPWSDGRASSGEVRPSR